MRIEYKDYQQLKEDYEAVDGGTYDNEEWLLYESKKWGEAIASIAVNLTRRFYVYTFKGLDETVVASNGWGYPLRVIESV